MNLDRVIAVRNTKTVYRDGDARLRDLHDDRELAVVLRVRRRASQTYLGKYADGLHKFRRHKELLVEVGVPVDTSRRVLHLHKPRRRRT